MRLVCVCVSLLTQVLGRRYGEAHPAVSGLLNSGWPEAPACFTPELYSLGGYYSEEERKKRPCVSQLSCIFVERAGKSLVSRKLF